MRKRRKGSYGDDVLSVCERDMQIEKERIGVRDRQMDSLVLVEA